MVGATNGWMSNLERMPTTNQKTISEALGVKGRNLIKSVRYKRKVTTIEIRGGGGNTEERKKTLKEKRPKGAEAPKGKTYGKRVVST